MAKFLEAVDGMLVNVEKIEVLFVKDREGFADVSGETESWEFTLAVFPEDETEKAYEYMRNIEKYVKIV